MQTGVRNALVLSSLVAAAGATWYLSRPAVQRASADGEQGAPLGYYMLDAVLSSTDAAGSTDFEIRTARLTELPAEDRVVLEDLVVAQTLEDSAWRITAEAASGPADGSSFVLEGNVVLRLERAIGDAYVIRIPRLELERTRQIARASGPIEIAVGASRLTAEALEVDLNTRRLTLESVQGMRTNQLTNAVAIAALSAAAAAQDDAPESTQAADAIAWESESVDCAEECVIQGFKFSGDNWRLEAREARAAGIDSVGDGEVRLTDVHFTFDGMSLATPSAVFELANDALVKALLTGDTIRFVADGARFEARSIVFTFEDDELATAELSGNPAVFEDLERATTATAETLAYDYGDRALAVVGAFTLNREGRVQLSCVDLRFYDLDTGGFRAGQCGASGVREGRAPTPQDGDAQGEVSAPALDPAPDGAP